MPAPRCFLSHGSKWLLVPRGLWSPAQLSLSFLRRALGIWGWKWGAERPFHFAKKHQDPTSVVLGGECLAQVHCKREGAGTQARIDACDHVHWDKTVSLNIVLSNKTCYFSNTLPGDACFVSLAGAVQALGLGWPGGCSCSCLLPRPQPCTHPLHGT